MADKKSNPAQIAQAVLDEASQSIKVTYASNQTVPVDIQDTEIAISMNKDEDSVTIYTPDNNTTPIPVNVETLPDPLNTIGEGEAATALRVHLSDETLTALGSPTVNVAITDVGVTSVPAPLNVTGPGVASAALRVQLADESLSALENINVSISNTSIEISNDVGNPIPISAASLPLPSNAATEAKQDSQITELQSIKGHVDQVEAKLDTLITQTDGVEGSLSSIDTKVSTSANQVIGNTSLSSINGKIPALGQAAMVASTPVAIASDQSAIPVSGSVTVLQSTAANLNATVTGTVNAAQSGTWNINNISGTINLPTGASTLSAQNTGNASLSSIDGKLNSLGQKAMTGSVPVVVASDNVLTTLVKETATYSAGVADLSPAATATDIVTISGAAGKVIKIYRIHITATATTGSIFDLNLIRRSTLNTGGTSTTVTPVVFDTLNAASSAVIQRYTANPTTLGTSLGVISQSMLYCSPTTNAANNFVQPGGTVELLFGQDGMQPLTLRNVNELIAINLDGQTITGANIEVDIQWTEE